MNCRPNDHEYLTKTRGIVPIGSGRVLGFSGALISSAAIPWATAAYFAAYLGAMALEKKDACGNFACEGLTMEKIITKEPRSGKKVVRNIALLVLGSVVAFSAASRSEPGPIVDVVVVAAFVLLAFAIVEAEQWLWQTRPNRR